MEGDGCAMEGALGISAQGVVVPTSSRRREEGGVWPEPRGKIGMEMVTEGEKG